MIACWLVGAPGVGKTTLVRQVVDVGWASHVPAPKWTVWDDVLAVGHYTGATHDGGDTVPYNGAAAALQHWRQHLLAGPQWLTVLDGDRFANANALAAVQPHATAVVVHLAAPDGVLDARRAARGTTQNPAWMKGRATKSRRFADLFPASHRLDLDASAPTPALAETWLAWLQQHREP